MNKKLLISLAMVFGLFSSVGFAKQQARKVANVTAATYGFIDARRAALQVAITELSDESQAEVAKLLGVQKTKNLTSYADAIMVTVQPEGEVANYTSILRAERAVSQVIDNVMAGKK